MPGLVETLDGLARVSEVRWYGHVLRKDNDDVLRALCFEILGRERGRPRMTWKKQVEEGIEQIGLKKEDTTDSAKERNSVYKVSRDIRRIRSPPSTET